MADWSSYRLEDFILFAPRAYWRLFELHNAALWPAQPLILLLGFGITLLALRGSPRAGRLGLALLAAGWVAVGLLFFWQRYASINWAAPYLMPVFLAQAILLLLAARAAILPARPLRRFREWGGVALFAYGFFLHPLLPLVFGRPLAQAELAGLAPDPTAIATLGLLCLLPRGLLSGLSLAVPVLWCLVSAATLHAMDEGQALAPLAAALVGAAVWALPPRGDGKADTGPIRT
ncbi:DUF6064 family protein [Oceanibaculum indicum]|uniref:MFS transporter permease n=1 Tax=Oceanibaculum indicum TaxID=526216 RepID=A0A420WRN9_9PROT|nr:DUF6064 family protein [Oceanibaculum indicum]RKQ73693.1 hypothetical protein BCL74_1484 [Oceanibaculum indicum]